jgi:hypothetical protein
LSDDEDLQVCRSSGSDCEVGLNEDPVVEYDLMSDLRHTDMFKVISDMPRSETLRIQQGKSAKFGYLPMMTVATLGSLKAECSTRNTNDCALKSFSSARPPLIRKCAHSSLV